MGAVLIASAGMASTFVARSQDAAAVAQADDPAIRSHWQDIDRRWNERDAKRFSELFAANAIFDIVNRDQRLKGREAIQRHFSSQFPGFAPELRHRTTVNGIRFPTPDVGVVEGGVEVLRLGEGEDAAVLRRFSIVGVMLRSGDGWLIHTLHAYPL
jgi:uncharacterized protein (TIGR02246 family)